MIFTALKCAILCAKFSDLSGLNLAHYTGSIQAFSLAKTFVETVILCVFSPVFQWAKGAAKLGCRFRLVKNVA